MSGFTITLRPVHSIDDDELLALSRENPTLRLERTSEGALLVSPPTGGETGSRNAELTYQLQRWSRARAHGKTFDSSSGFRLDNGAVYSPDAAWVRLERWNALSQRAREQFPPLAPDLAIELVSATDDARALHAKLHEFVAYGTRLALLLDPSERSVFVIDAGRLETSLDEPVHIDLGRFGADFQGLVLDVRAIFEA